MALIFLSELRVHNSFSMPLILDLRHLNSCLTLPFFLNISQIFRGQTRPYYGRNSQYFSRNYRCNNIFLVNNCIVGLVISSSDKSIIVWKAAMDKFCEIGANLLFLSHSIKACKLSFINDPDGFTQGAFY